MMSPKIPCWRMFVLVTACCFATVVSADQFELIGTLTIPGDEVDLSQQADPEAIKVPRNQFGGISAIAYTGEGNRYLLVPDRGPSDESIPYHCRFHIAELEVNPKADSRISYKLLATRLFTNEEKQPFIGSATAFDSKQPNRSLRLDPEGVRSGSDGSLFIADEFGPYVMQFSAEGRLLRRFLIPDHLTIKHPGASKDIEHQTNKTGRQTNRGFEGLAIDTDAGKLYAAMQGPLLQDQPFDAAGERLGIHNRILEIDIQSDSTREYVFPLDNPSHGISEILLSGSGRLWVLERDSEGGTKAKCKRLYEIELAEATDVSQIASLPATTLPAGIRPVSKRLALDLLDARYGLAGDQFPEKIEGIAFGPDLADGRRLLLVACDNDFDSANPTKIFAFAVASSTPTAGKSAHLSERARLANSLLPLAEGVTAVDALTLRGRQLSKTSRAVNPDGTVNVIIEIPAGTLAKWEIQREGEMIWEVRKGSPRIVNFLPYPGNYGMIPGTVLPKEQGGDGDPLDVLILGPALPRGMLTRAHVVGMLKFLDDGEQDDKLLAVVENTPLEAVRSLKQLRQEFPGAAEVVFTWFSSYKGAGGKMEFQGWGEADEAQRLIRRAIDAKSTAAVPPEPR